MSDAAQRRVGRYAVVATLGAGAMGEVLRARDEKLGREVAIKTVRNRFGMDPSLFHARFESEARALAALSHPAIVQVHDLGVDDQDEPYLVMELVDGPTLKAELERGPMSPPEVRAMGIQLARGLEAAHARGILHRDLKPANILRARNGQWKLADFGVAHVPDSSQTMTGQFLGTPAYAAPEALALGRFSEASDVFGLAATMVEALTGSRLRGDATLSELVRASGQSILMPGGVPTDLGAVLGPALSIDSAKRPSAARFAELLSMTDTGPGTAVTAMATSSGTMLIGGRSVARRPLYVVGAIAGAIVLIGLVAALSRGGDDSAAARSPAGSSPSVWREPPPAAASPRGFDGKQVREWNKIAEKVNEGDLEEAWKKLDKFERKFGRSAETEQLRAYLSQFEYED